MRIENWIRYAVGYVFITSGVMKLIMGDALAMFKTLGMPFPEITVFILSILEISCGAFIIARLYVKHAVLPLIVVMIGAIVLTKFPVLSGDGIVSFLFSARLEVVMLIFLLLLWRQHPSEKKSA